MREWLMRLLDRGRRAQLDAELAEELQFHREQLERDAAATGLDAQAARHAASRQLGNVTRAREDARARWSIPIVDAVLRDLHYAWRGLRRSPGFTLTVIVTLGLGIGANVTMFSVVDRLMYRPLAYLRDPATVHRVYWQWQGASGPRTSNSTTYRRFLDFQASTKSFTAFAGFSERDLAVGEGDRVRERRIAAVSATYFGFFDAQPVRGRFFNADEDVVPRGADVAVLSYDFWQSEYGGADVLGQSLQIGEVRARIIGVAPRGFAGVNDATPPVAWIPITTFAGSAGTDDARTYHTAYAWSWLHILVRRNASVSTEMASADASRALQDSWRSELTTSSSVLTLEAARPHAVVGAVRLGAGPEPALESRTAVWVSIVAGVVLLIACANVANLMLARALRRRRETAVRLALGAGRHHLLLQAAIECTLLAMLGGALALLIAQWIGTIIQHTLLGGTASTNLFTDWRTVLVTLGIVFITAMLIALLPTMFAGRARDLASALRGGVRGGARDGARIRAALLVVQASLSVVLLVGAALFVRSLRAVQDMRLGYDAEQVVLVSRVIRGIPMDETTQVPLRRLLLETAQTLPDVETAAWVNSAPFVSTSSSSLYVSGIDSVGQLGTFTFQAASPDYFRTMGTRIVQGRAFSAEDRLGTPEVMVVSASMARALWPGRDAIGQCVRVRLPTEPCRQVVGIAEDMVQNDLVGGTRYHFYMPIEQYTRTWGNGMLLRLRGDPVVAGERVRAALQRVMPGASYLNVRPLREIVSDAQRSWRLGATMFTAFGLLALVVAAVGLYGVIAYSVTERAHELSVRVALGAQRRDILRLVVGQTVRYTLIGTSVGLLVAAWSGHWLQPLLFQQSARDPGVFVAIALLMTTVALVASLTPALRAGRSDPAVALRAE